MKAGDKYVHVHNDQAKVTIRDYDSISEDVAYVYDSDPYGVVHTDRSQNFLTNYTRDYMAEYAAHKTSDAALQDPSGGRLVGSDEKFEYQKPKRYLPSCTCGAIFFGAPETGDTHSSFCKRRNI